MPLRIAEPLGVGGEAGWQVEYYPPPLFLASFNATARRFLER